MNYKQSYINYISNYLSVDSENIFLYWKGRVALYALLKTFDVKKGDEIILSGLTCVVVPNAIKYLDAKPVYTDVDFDTFNPTIAGYKEKVNSNTKVIILQNTFGLSSDVEEIVAFCKENHIYTIEDCTHGFGGTYNNKPNGTFCDAAIYSTQWNKPFSTGIGGFCLINNSQFLTKLRIVNKGLSKPLFWEESLLFLQYWIYGHFLNENNYWILRSLYRKLSKMGIVIGSSQRAEINDIKIPANYFKGVSEVQLKIGNKSIQNLDLDLKLRRKNSMLYSDFLKLNNKKYVDEKLWHNHSFLVYPILVNDRKNFMLKAEKSRIKLNDWFLSPLHPVLENLNKWDLNEDFVPVSSYLSKHLINLPTLENEGSRVTEFLLENLDNII